MKTNHQRGTKSNKDYPFRYKCHKQMFIDDIALMKVRPSVLKLREGLDEYKLDHNIYSR